MSELNFPIIIAEGLDLYFFTNCSDLELELEAYDIKRHVFKGYDASGSRINLKNAGTKIVVELAEAEPQHREELTMLLRDFLNVEGELKQINNNHELTSLLEGCKKYYYTPPQNSFRIFKRIFFKTQ